MSEILHAAGTIFTNKKGKILLLLRNKHSREGGLWGLVGGEIDQNEDNLTTAIREIKEEIKVDVGPSDLTFVKTYQYYWSTGEKKIVFSVFKSNINIALKFKMNTKEHSEYMWVLPKEAYMRKDLMVGLHEILADLYLV